MSPDEPRMSDPETESAARPLWILALDASTPRSVVALGVIDGERATLVVGDERVDGPHQASSSLLDRARLVLERAGRTASDLAFVACGRGPGTFTGTRVAIAGAMGLSLGAGCPVVPVSTLSAVAATASAGRALALLDARRQEVYAAVFTCGVDALGRPAATAESEERCVAPEALLDELGEGTIDHAVGPGVEPWAELLRARGIPLHAEPGPSADGLWHATASAWFGGAAIDPELLRAVYLRQSYAELGLNTPRRPFVKSPFV